MKRTTFKVLVSHAEDRVFPRLTDALSKTRAALTDAKLTDAQREAATERLQKLTDLANQLHARCFHWHDTGNNYFAVEAQVLAVGAGVGPPRWALDALQPGFTQHLKHPDRELGKQLGLSKRGSGRYGPRAAYKDRRALEPAMLDMHKLCAGCGIRPMRAARCVKAKHRKLTQKFESLAASYARKWRPMWEARGKLERLDTTARQRLFRTFLPKERRLLKTAD